MRCNLCGPIRKIRGETGLKPPRFHPLGSILGDITLNGFIARTLISPVRRNDPRAPFSPATCRGWSSRALPRVLQAVTAPVVFHFDLPGLRNAINGGCSGKVETRVSGHEPAPLAPCGRMHEVPSVRSAGRCLVESLRELVCRDEVRTRAECPARRTQCG